MKKVVKCMLLCAIAIVLVGCKDPVSEQPTVENKYAIGKTGPGGGTIYFYDNATGECKEVSEDLGFYNWYQASGTPDSALNDDNMGIARDYRGGELSNWYLPSSRELSEIFEAKIKFKILQNLNDYYWASGTPNGPSGPDGEEVYVSAIHFGYDDVTGMDCELTASAYVVAIRTFNTKISE